MARRVSLQGKGVDLFFGGDSRAASVAEPPAPETDEPSTPRISRSRTVAPPTTSVRARVRAHTDGAAPSGDAELFALIEDRQRLASSTFRFQPEELEQLDLVVEEIGRGRSRRLSKNDVVRLGLRWLLSDYESNRQRSLLGRLAARP